MFLIKEPFKKTLMNAKETLKKIADALGVVSNDPVEPEVEKIENEVAEPAVEEPTADAVETEEPKALAEPAEEPKAENETAEADQTEAEDVEPANEPSPEALRIQEMEQQIAALKEILTKALSQPEVETPKVEEEPKGLTHSPEVKPATKSTKIGQRGDSIESRVFKYINNK